MSNLPIDTLTVGPAYGRDYTTAIEARKAWNENRDFKCFGLYQGAATSKEDCIGLGVNVEIRYANLEKAIYIPVEEMKATPTDKTWMDAAQEEDDFAGMDEDDLEAVMAHLLGD